MRNFLRYAWFDRVTRRVAMFYSLAVLGSAVYSEVWGDGFGWNQLASAALGFTLFCGFFALSGFLWSRDTARAAKWAAWLAAASFTYLLTLSCLTISGTVGDEYDKWFCFAFVALFAIIGFGWATLSLYRDQMKRVEERRQAEAVQADWERWRAEHGV